ncbi:MAG: DUF4956 domain-containing protein [Acetatifactor sp.]
MTTFNNIIKSSFIDSFEMGGVTTEVVAVSLGVACILALYLFLVYFLLARKSFYNMNFNLSLVGMTVITAAIVLTIQSNLVLSLGMVGALSIVRYRSAVKDPMDLFFLFWGIANGIMSGARQYLLAVIVSLILTLILMILSHFPVAKAPYVLVVNASQAVMDRINETIDEYCRYSKVRANHIADGKVRMIVEIKAEDNDELLTSLGAIEGVSASILTYEGDIVC